MPEPFDLASLMVAHGRLMHANLDVLGRVERLGFFAPYRLKTLTKWWRSQWPLLVSLFTVRYLVKLFVQSHVQGKSNEVRTAYVRLAQSLVGSESSATKAWLTETADSLETYSSTLDSWRSAKGFFSLTWPVGVGFYVAWMGTDDLYTALLNLKRPSLELFLAAAMFPVVYFFLFFFTAFQYKRSLLYPQENAVLGPPDWDGPNVYERARGHSVRAPGPPQEPRISPRHHVLRVRVGHFRSRPDVSRADRARDRLDPDRIEQLLPGRGAGDAFSPAQATLEIRLVTGATGSPMNVE